MAAGRSTVAAGRSADGLGYFAAPGRLGGVARFEGRVQGSQELLHIFQQLRPIEQDRRSC